MSLRSAHGLIRISCVLGEMMHSPMSSDENVAVDLGLVPFNSKRLRPIRQRTRNAIVSPT